MATKMAIVQTEISADTITASLIARYATTIGQVDMGETAPHGLHWCLATPEVATDRLGPDGHPKDDVLSPPISLPRRMWASSDVEFLMPMSVGDRIERTSKLANVTEKSGSSGKLIFVHIAHETFANDAVAVREMQTLVYREMATTPAILPAAEGWRTGDADCYETITPDPQMLFRYSALTFNTHRIHYDLDYTTREEGYPALVVQGPLMASLLLRFASEHFGRQSIVAFSFKGLSPAYCGQVLHLGLKRGTDNHTLSVQGADGRMVMSASVST